jgi:hypothetical protein
LRQTRRAGRALGDAIQHKRIEMNSKNHGEPRKKRTTALARNASVREAASNASSPTDHGATVTDKEPETGYDLRFLVFGMLRPLYVDLPLKAEAVLAAVTDAVRQAEKDDRRVRFTTGKIDVYYRTLMKRRLLRNI